MTKKLVFLASTVMVLASPIFARDRRRNGAGRR